MCKKLYPTRYYAVVFLLLAGMVPLRGFSQWINRANGAPTTPSTAMWQFMQYGNTPVALYTGRAEVSVPLYEYKDYEFNIPVALRYAFSGQKPNEPAGPYGLGWVLDAGGCITRQVKGYPDESVSNGTYSAWGFKRFYDGEYNYIPTINEYDYQKQCYVVDGIKIEAEPDIFSFNFNGHSGKFMFWDKHQILVFDTNEPKGTYKIEPVMESATKFAGFTITTVDGFHYTFGYFGTIDEESKFKDFKIGSYVSSYGPRVMWPLMSIQAPSGRTVDFIYTQEAEFTDLVQPTSFVVELTNRPARDDKWTHYATISEHRQKNFHLTNISLEGTFSIELSYGLPNNKLEKYHNVNGILLPMTTEGLLKSVDVRDQASNPVRNISLNYVYGRPNTVPFLKEVHLSDLGMYYFDYWESIYAKDYTPYKGTCSIDHWGYYNGYSDPEKGSLGNYFPTSILKPNNNNEEEITGNQRNPSFEHALRGALQYITYPTGGRTVFTYEQNDYAEAVVKSGSGAGFPHTISVGNSQSAGGIRIKQIVDLDFNPRTSSRLDTIRVRNYSYRLNGRSTGVLLKSPRYRTHEVLFPTSGISTYYDYVSASEMLDCIETDHPLEYQVVTETERDGSFCRYVYSTYISTFSGGYGIPDIGTLNISSLNSIFGDMYREFYILPGSRAVARGNLISKTRYDASQASSTEPKPSYSEEYEYYIPDGQAWSVRMTRDYWYQRRICADNSWLYKTLTKTYLGDQVLFNNVYYQRDGNTGFVKRVESTDTQGNTTRQDLFYYDYFTDLPWKTQFSVKRAGEGDDAYKTTEINKYLLQSWRVTPSRSVWRIGEHQKTNLETPKVYVSEADQDADIVTETVFVLNSSQVLESRDRTGRPITYLYGANGCLLAVVEHVARTDVFTALSNSYNVGQYELSDGIEKILRNLPGAAVTTYSYIPMTGLMSVTDPSGCKRVYSYDSRRRLSAEYGGAALDTGSVQECERVYRYQLWLDE